MKTSRHAAMVLGITLATASIPGATAPSVSTDAAVLARESAPSAPARKSFTNADYAEHVEALKEELPDGSFHVVIERPFVVIGNEPLETVQRHAIMTVRWCVERLKREYFEADPAEIMDVWLFKDEASYEKHSLALFGRKPTTPFGCCIQERRALVMNIATGGGTLVHEIVHAFMANNFPDAPAWFSEGLASLYEQCGERDGRITGCTNWRLSGLQTDIQDGEVGSFKALCHTTSDQFYGEGSGQRYAQARYLCYYLQEKGLLLKYFREFRRNAQSDPSGYETLVKILNEPDMDTFQKKWEEFVLELRF